MDPGALGDTVALDGEVFIYRLARCDVAGRVKPHGLLQACVQVRHARQLSGAYAGVPANAVDFLWCIPPCNALSSLLPLGNTFAQ